MDDKNKPTEDQRKRAVYKYPGAAVEHDNEGRTDSKHVKDRTCTLNNNPRNQK